VQLDPGSELTDSHVATNHVMALWLPHQPDK
jgi:hypothetical protein